MTKQLNSHQFEQVYKDLGIDLDELGCIMADVVPLVSMMDPEGIWGQNGLPLHVKRTQSVNG